MKSYSVAIILLIFCFPILGQINGTVDSSFGNNGIIIINNSLSDDYARSSAIQEDNKIIVGGSSYDSITKFTLWRFKPNGELDLDFGIEGIVNTSIHQNSGINSVKIQSDGKILAAGSDFYNNSKFVVARYNSDGSLDSSFGENGVVIQAIGSNQDIGRSIVIQSDGKIIMIGESHSGVASNYNFAVVRFNKNGSLDNSFGINGIVTTDLGRDIDYPKDVILQNDNKIVVVGYSNDVIALVRYNTDGSVDSTFGQNGIVLTSPETFNYGKIAFLQPDNKIIVAASIGNGLSSSFALIRYNSDGIVDNSFGIDGIATNITGYSDDLNAMVIQSNGDIILAGTSTLGGWKIFRLSRFHANGTVDSNFGYNGSVDTDINRYDFCHDLILQDDKKVIAVGFTRTEKSIDIALVRYSADFITSSEIIKENNFSIYLNPVNEFIYINSDQSNFDFNIYDTQGKSRAKDVIKDDDKINISLLENGVYILKIWNQRETYVKKIIKNY